MVLAYLLLALWVVLAFAAGWTFLDNAFVGALLFIAAVGVGFVGLSLL